ncbi:MAG TPA: hypothetical protein VHN18_17285 [Micromonosporaceae bacterium]|nr:hypothetical protein [Micromonosporaceae bacterium]
MASSMKLDIRVARDAGGTHLVRSVDEVDLPWLLELISELQVERSAVVTLTDSVRGDELVIKIDQNKYHVEQSAGGIRSWLAPDREPGWSSDGSEAAEALSVDLEAARGALRSVITGKPLGTGVRWVHLGG